ncbi:tyrosine-type recombinase/integrase [Burkholderia vietnamiensis]|uniref:tyrosine-type recombinase/integrase n=1 Tax=Burkholderia vietnamiensis TaxID=60552 RepID=UPI000AC0A40F|nr:tyrosine-type recombinase/integrase [Burkholderia vietnamiensis]MCA7986556.1 tyrosine-type recombinase/integrase [Burkholderia vietnamiensis]
MGVHLFRIGKIWHYRFQVNGARIQRSTRETVKHKAEAVANRAYTKARMWARGDEPVPTLRELVLDWLKIHAATASAAHMKNVETFGRLHLYGLSDVLVDEITTEQVELARIEHLATHAPATANHWLKMLKTVCNWAVRRRVLPALPWSLPMLKVQKRPRVILPLRVATPWLSAVDALPNRHAGVALAVRLMLGLGLRESETITARWEWFDWERRTYTPGRTKGREALPLPVPDWLIDHLQSLRRGSGLVTANERGQPLPPGITRKAMLEANAACDIKGLTPHRLRGTFATLMSEQGVPAQTIQRLLRHKDIRTTMGYLEENLELAARAHQRIAQAAGFQARDNAN